MTNLEDEAMSKAMFKQPVMFRFIDAIFDI